MKCAGLHTTCETKTCTGVATTRVHWPGNTISLCGPCAVRAANVASAMGFALTTEQLLPAPRVSL